MWLDQLRKGRGMINTALGIACFTSALSYLVYVFYPAPFLFYTFSSMSCLLLIFSMITARLGNKLAALILMLAGLVIIALEQPTALALLDGFARNMNLIALFVMVPLIGVMISTGGYLTAMRNVLQNRKAKSLSAYRLGKLLTSSMGIFLNLGTLPIVHRVVSDSTTGYEQKKMGLVLQRAFVFCMFWSPYFVNVGLMLTLFDVTWLQIAGAGILFGTLYLVCSLYFNRRQTFVNDHWIEDVSGTDQLDVTEDKKKLIGLVRWSLCLLFVSLTLDFLTEYPMLTIVTVVALLYPFLWSVTIGVYREYLEQLTQYVQHVFHRLQNEILIFISAGFFGAALSYTQIGQWISEQILFLSQGSVLVFTFLVMLLTIGLAVLGIHPVIIVIGIGGSLSPDIFGVSPVYMAVLMLVSWALGAAVSPLSGIVLMTSNLTNERTSVIAKLNAPLTLFMVVLSVIILYALYVLNWI
jgi:TRAP-type C4-dicarboxylate transport system permease large subunit